MGYARLCISWHWDIANARFYSFQRGQMAEAWGLWAIA
jgi:hypothetical protein